MSPAWIVVALSMLVLNIAPAPADRAAAPLAVVRYRTADKLILLPVRIGTTTRWFDLDTGARNTVIDARLARGMDLRVVSHARGHGVGHGTYAQSTAVPLDVTIGAARYRAPAPWIIDLSPVHFSGLVGVDMLRRYVVRIDPVAQTIAFYDPATFRYAGAGTPLRITSPENRLFVDVALAVGGKPPVVHRVRIDTGSGDSVSDNLVRQSAHRRKSLQGVGLGKAYVDYSGELDSIGLGPYVVRHVWGPSNDQPAMGMEILRRFTLTFDVPAGRLYLEPNRNFADPVPTPGA